MANNAIHLSRLRKVVLCNRHSMRPGDGKRYPYPASRWQEATPGTEQQYHVAMKRKHQRTLELIFSRPVSGTLPWRDIEALFQELGGDVSERAGSRVAVVLFGEVRVFHRPHPSPDTDKGAVASIRKWLEEHGVSL